MLGLAELAGGRAAAREGEGVKAKVFSGGPNLNMGN
jgi:hypothetical protein